MGYGVLNSLPSGTEHSTSVFLSIQFSSAEYNFFSLGFILLKAKLAATTNEIAKGSNTNIINIKSQFITLAIDLPVSSEMYFRGPSSLSASLFVSLFKTAISNFEIESVTASSCKAIVSLSFIAISNSFFKDLLALEEVVVISCPDSLSIY